MHGSNFSILISIRLLTSSITLDTWAQLSLNIMGFRKLASRSLRKLLCGCVDAADERHPQPKGGLFYGLPAGFQFGREGEVVPIFDDDGNYLHLSKAYGDEVKGVDASLDRLRLRTVNKSSDRLSPPRNTKPGRRGFQSTLSIISEKSSVMTEKSPKDRVPTFSSRKGAE